MAGEIKLNNVSIATENAGTVTINNATLGNSMVLGTNASPIANNLVFANGNGIDFSAAAGSAAGSSSAVLDDYEEGTWEPSAQNVASTISEYLARYTKIGRIVHAYGYIIFSSLDNTDTSSFTIGGLPFAEDTSGNSLGTINRKYNVSPIFPSTAASDFTGLRVENSRFLLNRGSKTGVTPFLSYNECNSSGEFSFGLTYFTS